MDFLPEDRLLKHHPNTLEDVRKLYGLDEPEKMKEALEILENWIKQQNHFVKKDYPKHLLETLLISSKGSIERTKVKLDKIVTFKTLLPQYYGDYDIRTDFKDLVSCSYNAFLPKLTEDNNRVVFVKVVGNQFGTNFGADCLRLAIMFVEYFLSRSYAKSVIVIADYSEVDLLEMVSKLGIDVLRHGAAIMMNAYGIRVKEIHAVSSSKFAEIAIALFKQIVSPKLASRLVCHQSYETLFDYIPKDILPEEIGGKEKSYKIMWNEWLDALSSDKFREYNRGRLDAYTDESLRSKEKFNDQYMGMPGTFRTLSVD